MQKIVRKNISKETGEVIGQNSSVIIKEDSGTGGGGVNLREHLIFGLQGNYATKDINGSPDIQGDVLVEGNVNVEQNLAVSGTANVSGDSEFHGSLIVDDDLGVNGDITTVNLTASDTIKTKNLEVTGKATFFELVIDKIRAAQGGQIYSPADGFKVDHVLQSLRDTIRLFWRAEDADGKRITNQWQVNDQALCMSFNNANSQFVASNKYYWTLVVGVSSTAVEINGKKYHYIDVSTTTCDGTLNPAIGDEIVMLGHRGEDTSRQTAIYISAYGSLDQDLTAPFFAQYKGINDFSLSSHRQSYYDATGAKFIGDFSVSSGQRIEDYIAQEIAASSIPLNSYVRYAKEMPPTQLYAQDSDEMLYVGATIGTYTSAPTDYTKYVWLPKGISGEDGLTIQLSPATILLEGESNGTVTVTPTKNYVPVSIKAFRGNTAVLPADISVTSFTGHNITRIVRSTDSAGYPTLAIGGIPTVELSDRSTVSYQSGYIEADILVEGIALKIYIPYQVNFTTYYGELSVTDRAFRTEFTTYKNGIASQLSTIEQNADAIVLRVDNLEDDLIATGIDIENEKIKVTANNFEIQNNLAQQTMGVDAAGNLIAYGRNAQEGEDRQIIISPSGQSIKMKLSDSQQEGTDPDGNVFTLVNGDGAVMRMYSNDSDIIIDGGGILIGPTEKNITLEGESGDIGCKGLKTNNLTATTLSASQLVITGIPTVAGYYNGDDEWVINKSDSSYRNLSDGQLFKFEDHRLGGKVLMVK